MLRHMSQFHNIHPARITLAANHHYNQISPIVFRQIDSIQQKLSAKVSNNSVVIARKFSKLCTIHNYTDKRQ